MMFKKATKLLLLAGTVTALLAEPCFAAQPVGPGYKTEQTQDKEARKAEKEQKKAERQEARKAEKEQKKAERQEARKAEREQKKAERQEARKAEKNK